MSKEEHKLLAVEINQSFDRPLNSVANVGHRVVVFYAYSVARLHAALALAPVLVAVDFRFSNV